MNTRMKASIAVLAIGTLAFAGCAGTSGATSDSQKDTKPAQTDEISMPVNFTDGWAKATQESMSAVFGVFENVTDIELVVTAATCSTGGMVELHEVVMDASGSAVMQPKKGGFVIPAGGTHVLEPGGDHLMLMGLTDPIAPGDSITCEITISEGESLYGTMQIDVPAKEFSGANETYDH